MTDIELAITVLDPADATLVPDSSPQHRETRLIVVTHDAFAGAPGYREPQFHPDHRAAGSPALDAVYVRASGPLYYPDQIATGVAPHRVGEILLIMSDHVDSTNARPRSEV